MSKTIIGGFFNAGAKKVTGEGYTVEKILNREALQAEFDAKRKEYNASSSAKDKEEIEKEGTEIWRKLVNSGISDGFLITFDDIETCAIICQAWEHDDAITCVTFGLGKNTILVTTLNPEGKFVPTNFSFIATELGHMEWE